jgi:hypothetical protein
MFFSLLPPDREYEVCATYVVSRKRFEGVYYLNPEGFLVACKSLVFNYLRIRCSSLSSLSAVST